MAKKPKGFKKFDALMRNLVEVSPGEIAGKQHSWQPFKSGRRRGWHCRWCDIIAFKKHPPSGGCDWRFKKE